MWEGGGGSVVLFLSMGLVLFFSMGCCPSCHGGMKSMMGSSTKGGSAVASQSNGLTTSRIRNMSEAGGGSARFWCCF